MECCSEENSCKTNAEKIVCITCGAQAQKVNYKTVLMMLKFEQVKTAEESDYFLCTNLGCDTVYFSNKLNLIYNKNDIRIKIGFKEKAEPKLVCYCFDITEKQITDEVKQKGQSLIVEFITEKTRNKLCACSIKNPTGKCCLKNVNKIISNVK